MKTKSQKFLFLFFFMGITITSIKAQSGSVAIPTVNITPYGFRDENNSINSFVVIDCKGKTAMELYRSAVKYINKIYKTPSEVIVGQMEGEYLKFKRHQDNFITYNYGNYGVNTDYETELNFKDGRVKYEIGKFLMYQIPAKPTYEQYQRNPNAYNIKDATIPFNIVGKYEGVFRQNGEVRMSEAKKNIEVWFNTEIKALSAALNEGSNSGSNKW